MRPIVISVILSDRQEELHQRLLQHQEKGVGEMRRISTEVDPGNLPQQARSAVKEQDLVQALYSLALLKPPLDPDRLRRDMEEGIEKTTFQFMLPTKRVNALGRVVAARPSGMDEPEKALKAMLHDDANRSHQFDASALINPARIQILNDHPTVQIRDLMPLTHHNAFVPRNRQL